MMSLILGPQRSAGPQSHAHESIALTSVYFMPSIHVCRGERIFCLLGTFVQNCPWLITLRTKWMKIINRDPVSSSSQSPGCHGHLRVWVFFGTVGLLGCHKWLWIVSASTLTDMVLAGIRLNCFRSELYLYSLSIIFLVMFFGPVPVSL